MEANENKDLEKFEQVLSQVGYWRHDLPDEENYGIKMNKFGKLVK